MLVFAAHGKRRYLGTISIILPRPDPSDLIETIVQFNVTGTLQVVIFVPLINKDLVVSQLHHKQSFNWHVAFGLQTSARRSKDANNEGETRG